MSMAKLFLSLILSFSLAAGPSATRTAAKAGYVYLCEGPYSKVYHLSEHCKGLSRCSTRIDKVTLEEAQRRGRRPCKIEY